MPSTSKKQHNFMEAIAHSPEFAKKAGVPQSVGKDFAAADKGKKFRSGGMPKDMESKLETRKEMSADKKQDVALIKKAFREHDSQEHKGGKGTSLKLAKGGINMKKKSVNPAMAVMAARAMRTPAQAPMQAPMAPPPVPGGAPMGGMGGGMGMKSGGRTPVKGDHSAQKKDKVGAKMIKMASGGLSAGHKSANGVATKGLTKGKMVSMCGGGMGKKK